MFKAGDTIRILDTPNVRTYESNWRNIDSPIGVVWTLREDEISSLILNENHWGVNFKEEDFKLVSNQITGYSGEYYQIPKEYYSVPSNFYGTFPRTSSEPKVNKFMSIIKNIFRSEEQKALTNYGITNGDGGLTSSGREELLDFIWETNKEVRKDFVAKIIETYKEEKK